MGILFGLIVAIGAPVGYLFLAYAQLNNELTLLTDIKATRLARYIYVHQELWQYQTFRLTEITEIPEARQVALQQRIFDVTGELVVDTGSQPAFPVARWTQPVLVSDLRVATVETAASLRPIVIGTAIVALLSSLLGIAAFFVIRILPLRAIDRTLAELAATQN